MSYQSTPPDTIIRSFQKDHFYLEQITESFRELLVNFFGEKSFRFTEEIKLLATLMYHGLLSGRGHRTLGEEYCEILQIIPASNMNASYSGNKNSHSSTQARLPHPSTRFSLIFISTVLPYLINHLQKLIHFITARVSLDNKKSELLVKLQDFLIILHSSSLSSTISRLHLAWFYFSGCFYEGAKRIFNIRYIDISNINHHRKIPSYHLLGLVILVRIIITYISFLKVMISSPLETISETSPSISSSKSPDCFICMTTRHQPTITECGHIFCWKCVAEWCAKKNICPICRKICDPRRLLLLANYH